MKRSLSINLNKIALIRNSRAGNYPDLLAHADVCIKNGVDGITVHPRPDLRHITPKDVCDLSNLISNTKKVTNKSIEFNVEGNPFASKKNNYPGFIEIVNSVMPHQCTLVPDSSSQLTSDHGFDLKVNSDKLYPVIQNLKSNGIRVCLFMDPEEEQVRLARELEVDRVELFTGPYAAAWGKGDISNIFEKYRVSASIANKLGMGVNAGHDLNLLNLTKFCTIPDLKEFSIGHALIVDAISMGLDKAIGSYIKIIKSS